MHYITRDSILGPASHDSKGSGTDALPRSSAALTCAICVVSRLSGPRRGEPGSNGSPATMQGANSVPLEQSWQMICPVPSRR